MLPTGLVEYPLGSWSTRAAAQGGLCKIRAHISMEPCTVDGSSKATVVLGRTCELAGEVGVVGFRGGDVSAQQLWRQRLGAVRGRGCAALLVHRQHMRRQPPVLLPGRCESMTYFSFLIFISIPYLQKWMCSHGHIQQVFLTTDTKSSPFAGQNRSGE